MGILQNLVKLKNENVVVGKTFNTSEVAGSHTEKQFLPKSSEIYPFQTTHEEKS